MWHPRCGPCPSNELGGILDGSTVGGNQINGNITDTECDRLSNSVISEMQVRVTFFYRIIRLVLIVTKIWPKFTVVYCKSIS